MRKLWLVLLLITAGCGVSKQNSELVREQHVIYNVYVHRMDDSDPTNDPTPEQNKQMIRDALGHLEALDREINNWKPSPNMGESNVGGTGKSTPSSPGQPNE